MVLVYSKQPTLGNDGTFSRVDFPSGSYIVDRDDNGNTVMLSEGVMRLQTNGDEGIYTTEQWDPRDGTKYNLMHFRPITNYAGVLLERTAGVDQAAVFWIANADGSTEPTSFRVLSNGASEAANPVNAEWLDISANPGQSHIVESKANGTGTLHDIKLVVQSTSIVISTTGVTIDGEAVVTEAPSDGKNYVRNNGAWVALNDTLELRDVS